MFQTQRGKEKKNKTKLSGGKELGAQEIAVLGSCLVLEEEEHSVGDMARLCGNLSGSLV